MERGNPVPPKLGKPSFDFSKTIGLTCFDTKTITTLPIINRYTLYVGLHECGHAALHRKDYLGNWLNTPDWQVEYEAETYAIKAMRAAGVPVPRVCLHDARDYVGSLLEKCGCADAPDEVWRFAHPKGRR